MFFEGEVRGSIKFCRDYCYALYETCKDIPLSSCILPPPLSLPKAIHWVLIKMTLDSGGPILLE